MSDPLDASGSQLDLQLAALAQVITRPDEITDGDIREGFDVMPLMIIDLSSKKILYSTHSLEEKFGYEAAGELKGMSPLVLFPPDKRDEVSKYLDDYDKYPTRGILHTNVKLEGYRRNGTNFNINVFLYPYVRKSKRLVVAFVFKLPDTIPC